MLDQYRGELECDNECVCWSYSMVAILVGRGAFWGGESYKNVYSFTKCLFIYSLQNGAHCVNQMVKNSN